LPARILCTALFVWILLFPVPIASAQDDRAGDRPAVDTPDPENAAETPDPIRTRQEQMVFGGGGTETEPEAARPVSAVSAFSIIRMLLTLAVVAAAIYGLVYFLKVRRTSRAKAELDPFLKILANAPLGPNRGVYVLSVGPQVWLVGSAETGVNLISEITDKDTINAMLLEDSKRIAGGGALTGAAAGPLLDFRAMLEKLGFSAKTESSGPDQIRKRRERLKGL